MRTEFPVTKILAELEADRLLPAILFRTARKQCDFDIEQVERVVRNVKSFSEQQQFEADVEEVAQKYNLDLDIIKRHPQYRCLVRTRVGAHHAGQLVSWRLLLEDLMSRGVLKLMIATGTVAAGVDFPARTVVVTAHSRRGSEGFRTLSSSEFQQMSGRAGRRGKDTVGFCLIAPGPFSDARVISEVAKRPPEPLRSAYFAAPSTVLNLLKFRNVDDLKHTVSLSLAGFIDARHAQLVREEAERMEREVAENETLEGEPKRKAEKRVRRKRREADELEGKQLAQLEMSLKGLESLGYVNAGALTENGFWAAELCTSLVLQLGEAIDSHLFTDIPLEELVGLIASIAGDSHRTYLKIKKNPIPKERFKALTEIVERIAVFYQGTPFASETAVVPDGASTVLAWLDASSWDEYYGLLKLGGVAEGDAARLISQTADHLNQISRLTESHPPLAEMASNARKLLLRPPITDALQVEAVI